VSGLPSEIDRKERRPRQAGHLRPGTI